jgi:hypothetical protein
VVSHRIEMREADMTESGTPIMSQSVRFRVGGMGRGQGIVLLYPDRLVAVNSWAELCGIVLGTMALTVSSVFLFHDIYGLGSAAGALAGGWIGQAVGKRLAAETAGAERAGAERAGAERAGAERAGAERAGAGHDSVRLIPLDSITSVQVRNSTGIQAWLFGRILIVTTADGTEHQFRGRLVGWQSGLAGALTLRGCDVQDTPQGITVTSRAWPEMG